MPIPEDNANSLNWGKWSNATFWEEISESGNIITLNDPEGLPRF